MQFPLEQKKQNLPDSELNSLEGQARYFTVLDRHKIKLDKNKMDSKLIKSHQYSLLERSHAVFWLKLILNSDQDLLNKNRFLQVY